MASKLKVYCWHDGRRLKIVAAANAKEAAAAFRTSIHDLRRFGGIAQTEITQVALTQPGTVFSRNVSSFRYEPYLPA